MKTLYEAARAQEIKARITQLQPESERLWGKMTPAQTLAHCTVAFAMTRGEVQPPRIFIGRLLGSMAKKSLIIKGQPMMRNAKTDKSVLITDDRDFDVERARLLQSIDRFVSEGPPACTQHPHFFFGPLTPEEWSSLMYQHLDHHLRQFGV